MQKNILEYLDKTALSHADKTAFGDDWEEMTFGELKKDADAIASRLLELEAIRRPVAVYLPKSCDSIRSFMGIAGSGGFYCPVDTAMPPDRASAILNILKPVAVITSKKYEEKLNKLGLQINIVRIEDAKDTPIQTEQLQNIRERLLDLDPLYVLFTSGSTGIPKGVLISHRAVIDYIDWVTETFDITDKDTFGNQAPFYFDNSILDIYCALKNGSTVYIIPQRKFLFPADLISYLNEKKINTIFWVPSALCSVVNLKGLELGAPLFLRKVLFCGEVMPNKQLNAWRKAIPDALYANLYGPTEITDVCTYYIIDREFQDDEPLPIGIPCRNTRILILNDQDKPVQGDEPGELCVSGTCLALGYYRNPEKTKEAFVQNPLNDAYEEKIYRTGDIVKYNDRGEILYLSRKDFQIKHMGHRIELGEIETALGNRSDIANCAGIYDDEQSMIVMCYTGTEADPEELVSFLKKKIPKYMIPDRFVYCKELPYNANGKIDRIALKKSYI